MPDKIILSVTNDTFSDSRVHKMAKKIFSLGYQAIIVGKHSKQKIIQSNYAKTVRLRLLFKKGFMFYAEYNIKLFFYLLFSKVDIYFSNDLDTLPANYLASMIRRKQLVYDSHELFVESPEIINRKALQRFWQGVERFCIKGINIGITVSQPIASHYERLYNKKFLVVRNVPYYNEKLPENIDLPNYFNNSKIIIYQGALNIGRGLEMAIDAFNMINDAIFVIIGSGDIEKGLRQRVVDNGLQNKVFFTGRISQQELPAYTRRALIGLSIEEKMGKNYEYALPNKLFDYIHAGVPVIVSDMPEMKKIVEKYQIGEALPPSGEAMKTNSINITRSFAEKVSSMLNSPEKLKNYRKNCLDAAKELCWENETLLLDSIFKKNNGIKQL